MEGLNLQRWTWPLRRWGRASQRRFGWWGWAMLMAACLAVAAGGVALERRHRHLTQLQIVAGRSDKPKAPVVSHPTLAQDNAALLQAFERQLLDPEEIPTLIQDLLELAAKDGLVIRRGEYKLDVDVDGGFARYRMSLPVQGPAPAIQRFVQRALVDNKALAVEGVQFKRERADSTEGDAKVQWVAFTRLPAEGHAKAVAVAKTGSGQ